jgi:hypothetical protein
VTTASPAVPIPGEAFADLGRLTMAIARGDREGALQILDAMRAMLLGG